jgi:SUZ domain
LPNGPTAVKIMRRTALAANKVSNDGSTAASSSAPSKATSEAGAETTSDEGLPSPPNVTSSKDRSKLTREEKEAHYKAARERIFRDFQEAHGSENSTADTSANMSRSSSSSGKKKGHKQKAPRDDSFEARSSYVPGFPGMSHSAQNQYNGPFGVSGYQSPYGAQTPDPMPAMAFGSNATPAYNQYDPSTTFPGMNFSSSYPNQYGSNDGWSNPQSPPPGGYYNFGQQPASNYSQYAPAMSPPVNQYPQIASPGIQSPGQQWAPIQYQQPFQAQPPMQPPMAQNGGLVSWPGYPPQANSHMQGGPYRYGQGPFQQYPSTPPSNHPHPLPGSYNRPAFNPQIRSFVPAGPNMRFGGQANQVRPAISPFSGQGSISSQNTENPDSGVRASSAPNKAQESLQKKWGTPAHLPKKPPPSQVPSTFEIENTPPLPSQQSFSPLASSIVKVSPPVGNN